MCRWVAVFLGRVDSVEDGAGCGGDAFARGADGGGVAMGPAGDVAEGGAVGVDAVGGGHDVYVDSSRLSRSLD